MAVADGSGSDDDDDDDDDDNESLQQDDAELAGEESEVEPEPNEPGLIAAPVAWVVGKQSLNCSPKRVGESSH